MFSKIDFCFFCFYLRYSIGKVFLFSKTINLIPKKKKHKIMWLAYNKNKISGELNSCKSSLKKKLL